MTSDGTGLLTADELDRTGKEGGITEVNSVASQGHWVSALCPSPGILSTGQYDVSEAN
jgi:hypothetical protein